MSLSEGFQDWSFDRLPLRAEREISDQGLEILGKGMCSVVRIGEKMRRYGWVLKRRLIKSKAQEAAAEGKQWVQGL